MTEAGGDARSGAFSISLPLSFTTEAQNRVCSASQRFDPYLHLRLKVSGRAHSEMLDHYVPPRRTSAPPLSGKSVSHIPQEQIYMSHGDRQVLRASDSIIGLWRVDMFSPAHQCPLLSNFKRIVICIKGVAGSDPFKAIEVASHFATYPLDRYTVLEKTV
ncbi:MULTISPECIES: hypothetical protein [unclassified Rhizobium]|uniref:hypothetical protein n=1 Tax=unclassified Rhizobium TaxID=2613769 RepID=UPI0013C4C587|nr:MULTISPECIES: hypothetical protein [unclassified Rhizobium]